MILPGELIIPNALIVFCVTILGIGVCGIIVALILHLLNLVAEEPKD